MRSLAERSDRPMRLVVLNLRTDVDHTALGFTTAWINAMAPAWEIVDVITMHAGRLDVAPNVRVWSMGREAGVGRVQRVFRFYRSLARISVSQRPDAIFSHMSPLLAAMAAPIARLLGAPILLWYAHGNVTRQLAFGERLSDRCVTSTPEGFRLPSRKLAVLGQGVDTHRFGPPHNADAARNRTLLTIGRLTSAKRVDLALEILARVLERHPNVRLRVVGGPVGPDDTAYGDEVKKRSVELGVADAVDWVGPVPFAEIADEYRHGLIFLNLSTTGSLDKAILEAMASGCIPVSRNEAFSRIAGEHGVRHLVPGTGVDDAARVVDEILAMPSDERNLLQRRLRTIVVEEHSLAKLTRAVNTELRDLASRRLCRHHP